MPSVMSCSLTGAQVGGGGWGWTLIVGSVCVLGTRKGGGIQGGSYLFVLPSRRVREQIKGFSSGGWG